MKKRNSISYAKYGYIFSIPFVLAWLIFSLYPTIYTVVLGFTDLKGIGRTDWNFLEDIWANYKVIFRNRTFRYALGNTFRLWIINFIPQIVLALALSYIFTSRRLNIRAQGLFKVVFYMPNIITAATIAILFNALFAYPKGPVNDILIQLGLRQQAFNYGLDKTSASLIVSFIQFWMWYGSTMIILIAGITGINPEIFESAECDGANDVQTFFYITMPNLKTILLYVLVTSSIGGLNMFDIPRLFLNGGPDNATLTVSMFIYNQAFSGSYLYNRASAASMILFLIVVALSSILFFLLRDRDDSKVSRGARNAAE